MLLHEYLKITVSEEFRGRFSWTNASNLGTYDDRLGEGGRVQQNLTWDRKFANNGIDNTLEKVGQKFISLIQNDLETELG